MDFWFKPWIQIGNDFSKFQSKVPTKPQQQASIPTQPMQSYNVWFSSILPWVSEEKANKLISFVNTNAKSETEKKLMLNDLHQEAIKREQQEAFQSDRSNMKSKLMQQSVVEKDPTKKNQMKLQVNMANFADILREWAKKDWVDISSMPDKEVVDKYLTARPEEVPMMTDFLNGKLSSVDVGKKIWLIEETPVEPVEEKNPLMRAWAWLVKWAIGAVKGAYEWLVPWFKEMIQDSKRIIADQNKSAPEKFNQILFWEIGADYIWWAIWDTFWWALWWLYEWFTTSTEREFINEKVKWVMEWIMEKEPVQNIMKKYNQLEPTEQQELNDLMWYAMNAMEFVGIWLWAKPVKEAGVKWLKVGKEILEDTLWETTEQVFKKWWKIAKKVWEISPIESTAKAFTKTATPQDKLFKAQNPSLNVLNKNRDFKTVRQQSDLANQLVVDAGHIPVDTETRRIAHESTMKSKWAEVESKIADKKELMVDQNQFADILDDVVRDAKESWLVKNKSDIIALEAEAKAMRKQGAIDLPTLEKRKQYINWIVNNWWDSAIGDVYKNGMKKVTRAIGEVEDATLAKIPWEFSTLKKEFWALKSTYEDILKADIKNQKSKWADIMQTYSRIEGIGDILGWTMSIFTRGWEWVKDVAKWVWKLFLWKALKKATDSDFLIKEWFENLSRKIIPNATKNLPMNNIIKPVNSLGQTKTNVQINKAPKLPKAKNESIPQNKVTVKAPEDLYHTSTQEIWKLTDDKVLRTTPDSKYTLKYWKEGSRNTYKVSSEWLNILDWTSKKWIDVIEWINKKLWDKWFSAGVLSDDGKVISFVLKDKNFVSELKKMWYDWLRTTESSMKWWAESIWIINPSKVKNIKSKWLKPKK